MFFQSLLQVTSKLNVPLVILLAFQHIDAGEHTGSCITGHIY